MPLEARRQRTVVGYQPSIGFVQRHRTFVGHVAAKRGQHRRAGGRCRRVRRRRSPRKLLATRRTQGTRRHGPRRRSSRSRAPREGLPAPSRPVGESRRRDEARRGSRLSPCRSSRSASSGLSRRRRGHVGSVRGEHAGGQGVERRGALPSDCADASSGLLKSQAPPDYLPVGRPRAIRFEAPSLQGLPKASGQPRRERLLTSPRLGNRERRCEHEAPASVEEQGADEDAQPPDRCRCRDVDSTRDANSNVVPVDAGGRELAEHPPPLFSGPATMLDGARTLSRRPPGPTSHLGPIS